MKYDAVLFSPINRHFIIISYISVYCKGIKRKKYDMIQFFMLVFIMSYFFCNILLRRGRRVFKEGTSFFK